MKKRRMTASERRQQILDVSIRVFSEFGLDGARTRQIADACGINEALLYKHFPSKDTLFVEAMLHLHDKLADKWWEAIDDSPNGLEAIRRIQGNRIRMMFEEPQLCRNILHGAAAATRESKMMKTMQEWLTTGQEYTEGMLRKGIEDGSIRPDIDIEAVTWLLRGLAWYVNLSIVIELHESLDRDRSLEILDCCLDLIAMPEKS